MRGEIQKERVMVGAASRERQEGWLRGWGSLAKGVDDEVEFSRN
jgi:hypothetical protein